MLLAVSLVFFLYYADGFAISAVPDSGDDVAMEPLPHLELYKKGNSYYYFGNIFKGNYWKSIQFCNYHGMSLVSIETAEENNFLYNSLNKIYNKKGDYHFWTSGTILPDGAGPFVWLSTGSPINYNNWTPGQPDNAGNNEKCMEVVYNVKDHSSLVWNDKNCDAQIYLICETTSIKPVVTALSNENNCNVTFIDVQSSR